MPLTLPNILTLLRIFLIPCIAVVFYLPFDWAYPASAFLFAFASITDFFDGYLARTLNQSSAFGAFLDPVADKVMVAIILILLLSAYPNIWMAIPAAIIIGREITISALREWMAELGKRSTVAVSMMGKFKTAAQMGSLFFLLYQHTLFGVSAFMVGLILLYIAALLTIVSMVDYVRAAWPELVKSDNA